MQMFKAKYLSVVLCSAGILSASQAMGDDFYSFDALVGEFDAGNAGLEIAMLNIKDYDLNPVDGYPEQFGIRFDVYTAGTKTLRYSTPWRYFNRPAIPAGCSPTNGFFEDMSPKILRRTGTTRIHIGFTHSLECFNGGDWVSSYASNIYSTTVTPTPGTTWMYKLPGYELTGFEGIDTNNDGINDTLMLTHIYDVGVDDANAFIVFLNPATGAAALPNATYPIKR
jgi:hypothetical protein